MGKDFNMAIVGATGAVGTEFLQLLGRRDFPIRQLKLLASPKSAGKRLVFQGREGIVQALTRDSFEGVDFAFFSAGASTSKEFAGAAVKAGAIVIDNSSAFRMEPDVPLVIPEINPEDAWRHHGVVAVPNCTTIVALMALFPLHRTFKVRRVIAASYQAVSGAGAKAIAELSSQVQASLAQATVKHEVFPHPIAFNVLPQVDTFLENGYTKEEVKFLNESRKILHHPTLRASITCVRVPVYRAHSVAINAEFERPISLDRARDVLAKFQGLELVDDPASGQYPMPLRCAGKETCEVGRVRIDTALENGLAFWVCGDQLLKGAALNAVQIAELLIKGHGAD
jgi:aspartate-semialdehyde dehydrogenase